MRLLLKTVAVLAVLSLLAGACSTTGTDSNPPASVTSAVTTTLAPVTTSAPGTAPATTSTMTAAPPGVLATARAGPVPPIATCPPGSDPSKPGSPDQARPPAGFHTMAVDRQSGRIVVFAAPSEGLGSTWTFDLCTNTWEAMHPDIEPPATLGRLVYDEDSDVVIGYFWDLWNAFWAYDLEANVWTELAPWSAPISPLLQLAYDPVSGLIVGREPRNSLMWAYDVETDRWTNVQADPRPPSDWGSTLFTFDRSADRLVLHHPWAAWEEAYEWAFDPRQGTWIETEVEFAAPQMSFGSAPELGAALDEASGRLVMASDGVVAAYDAKDRKWDIVQDAPTEPPPRVGCRLVYDPVNERLVAYGDESTGEDSERVDDVWAFDLEAREWTQLLAPNGTEVWDLVWISDSSGFRTAHAYAARIEADLGVQVEVHDLWGPGLSARLILEALRGERNVPSYIHGGVPAKPLIKDAEVIVIHGNPLMSEGHPSGSSCPVGPVENLRCAVPPAADYAGYEADVAGIFDEIFAIRDGEPVILRTYDAIMPTAAVNTWRSCGEEYANVCTGYFIDFSDAIHRAAADYGVPVAGLLQAFHGPDVDQDAQRELFGDGLHNSEEGAAAIAEFLANLGYEPVTP